MLGTITINETKQWPDTIRAFFMKEKALRHSYLIDQVEDDDLRALLHESAYDLVLEISADKLKELVDSMTKLN